MSAPEVLAVPAGLVEGGRRAAVQHGEVLTPPATSALASAWSRTGTGASAVSRHRRGDRTGRGRLGVPPSVVAAGDDGQRRRRSRQTAASRADRQPGRCCAGAVRSPRRRTSEAGSGFTGSPAVRSSRAPRSGSDMARSFLDAGIGGVSSASRAASAVRPRLSRALMVPSGTPTSGRPRAPAGRRCGAGPAPGAAPRAAACSAATRATWVSSTAARLRRRARRPGRRAAGPASYGASGSRPAGRPSCAPRPRGARPVQLPPVGPGPDERLLDALLRLVAVADHRVDLPVSRWNDAV